MTDIPELLQPLNLIYYEYDALSNTLILDRQHTSDAAMELVSLTHLLQRHNIRYFIDKEQHLHIVDNPSWFKRAQYTLQTYIQRLFRQKPPIYLLSDKASDDAENIPVIAVRPIPSEIDFDLYDGVICTSKNALTAVDSFTKRWRYKAVYALAPQTAKTVKMLKGQLRFVGKSHYGDAFAEELIKPLQGKRVLYLRARHVASNLCTILNDNGVKCDEKVVYETSCRHFEQKITLPQHSIVVFSSPSTIDCFFKNADWDPSYTAIAIGQTTAHRLPEVITPYIAETTSIEACIRKAVSLRRKRS